MFVESDAPQPDELPSADGTNNRHYTCKLLIMVAGFLLPFGVATFVVLLTALGIELSDTTAWDLIAFSFVGIPLATVGAIVCLPQTWAIWIRVATAILLAPPLCLIAIYIALHVFVLGYVAVGGWIPA